MRTTVLLPVLALVPSLGLGGCSIHWNDHRSHPFARTVEFQLTADEVRDLSISGDLTDVEVRGGSPQPVVVAKIRERHEGVGTVALVDGRLSYRDLTGREGEGFMEHVTVWLPAEVSSLRVDVSHGDVWIVDVDATGPLKILSGLGDIELENVSAGGGIDAWTGLGDVDVSGVNGSLRVETKLGDVTVHRLRGPSADIRTGLGDIELVALDVQVLDYATKMGDVHSERIGDSVPQSAPTYQ
ncbi:hypothetical protein Pla163_27570 [Planctomycetes bacterium Pla163]|uniref:DUF4097 domain-containing protein n=1 Tax=Rohdeia mirabilis TaxID=2528008 RepID=A0A518D2F1_9BACT|nr:hypothetical protein Pla163_27570 [Planctomycetes bacterium Pla163]